MSDTLEIYISGNGNDYFDITLPLGKWCRWGANFQDKSFLELFGVKLECVTPDIDKVVISDNAIREYTRDNWDLFWFIKVRELKKVKVPETIGWYQEDAPTHWAVKAAFKYVNEMPDEDIVILCIT